MNQKPFQAPSTRAGRRPAGAKPRLVVVETPRSETPPRRSVSSGPTVTGGLIRRLNAATGTVDQWPAPSRKPSVTVPPLALNKVWKDLSFQGKGGSESEGWLSTLETAESEEKWNERNDISANKPRGVKRRVTVANCVVGPLRSPAVFPPSGDFRSRTTRNGGVVCGNVSWGDGKMFERRSRDGEREEGRLGWAMTFSDGIVLTGRRPMGLGGYGPRMSDVHRSVYSKWIGEMLDRGVIERCEREDCQIFLRPLVAITSNGQNWKVRHDCSVVNSLVDKRRDRVQTGAQHRIHAWAANYPYLGRIKLEEPCFALTLAEDQRKYYSFFDDDWAAPSAVGARFYRYLKVPPDALGAESHLVEVFSELARRVAGAECQMRFRKSEVFFGGLGREVCGEMGRAVSGMLSVYGFQIKQVKSGDLPFTACCGLLHDRHASCLRLTNSRLAYLHELAKGLKSRRWRSCGTQLVSCLKYLRDLLPAEWVRELSRLERFLLDPQMDAQSLAIWEEHFVAEACYWTLPFKVKSSVGGVIRDGDERRAQASVHLR